MTYGNVGCWGKWKPQKVELRLQSNVVELRPKRTQSQKYRAALSKQRGVKVRSSEDMRQDWLVQLVGDNKLSRAAIRMGVVMQMVEFRMGRFHWPSIRHVLGGLHYKQSTLERATAELIMAGLLKTDRPIPSSDPLTAA